MIDTLNRFELKLIESFKVHPLFRQIEKISWSKLIEILIQRRFLSLSIVNLYEFVIDALTDDSMKVTVRNILSEEFPRNTKGHPLLSHRELLFQDLKNLGATPELILTTPESSITQQVRTECFRQLIHCLQSPHSQIGLITFLRFWAEVLVSIEYTCLWERLSERLSNGHSPNKVRSEFYYFHMIHDSRRSDIGKEGVLGGLTHSQELAIHLERIITSTEALEYAQMLEKKAYQLKSNFYDQFSLRSPSI